MGDKEFILSGFEAPSSDLNNLIHDFKLDKWPNIEPTPQTNDVVHTTRLTYTTATNGTSENELTTNVIYEPKVEVVLEQRMVRFIYDSELKNRNFGKEVLAKIVIRNYVGKVKIRIHAVDDKRMKAHPFCLIGDKCNSGVYLEEHDVSTDKTDCMCKATARIPEQKEYETELQKRKTEMFDVKKFPYITADMNKDDYWTSNKGMKKSEEILLMVEVLFVDANNQYIAIHSEPISNAKDGKKFEVHAVSPTTSSVSGSQNDPHFIILTSDSYSPNESDIVIRFHDDGDWKKEITGKVIENVIEFHFPGYKDCISVPKTVYVTVYDKKRKIETSRKPIILQPTDSHHKEAWDGLKIQTARDYYYQLQGSKNKYSTKVQTKSEVELVSGYQIAASEMEIKILSDHKVMAIYGSSVKVFTLIKCDLPHHGVKVSWQKVKFQTTVTLDLSARKYFGSSTELPTPDLVINGVSWEDAGVYQLEVVSRSCTVVGHPVIIDVSKDSLDVKPLLVKDYAIDCIISRPEKQYKTSRRPVTMEGIDVLNAYTGNEFEIILHFQKVIEKHQNIELLQYSVQRNNELLCRFMISHLESSIEDDVDIVRDILMKAIKNGAVGCSKALSWLFTRLFYKSQKSELDQVYDIWPAFRCCCPKDRDPELLICSSDVQIIVEDDAVNLKIKRFHEIPVRFVLNHLKSYEAEAIHDQIQQTEGTIHFPPKTYVNAKDAEDLFDRHSKLTLISLSSFKSRGFQNHKSWIPQKSKCLQLYCTAKQFIPVGENHFPTEYNGLSTDVIEGSPSLCTRMNIKVGSVVSRAREGTLGGFLKIKGREAYATCAHVLFSPEQLASDNCDIDDMERLDINLLYTFPFGSNMVTGVQKSGDIFDVVFKTDSDRDVSIDAALVEVNKETMNIDPNDYVENVSCTKYTTSFIGMQSEYLNTNCIDHRKFCFSEPKPIVETVFVGGRTGIKTQTNPDSTVHELKPSDRTIYLENLSEDIFLKEMKVDLITTAKEVVNMLGNNPSPSQIQQTLDTIIRGNEQQVFKQTVYDVISEFLPMRKQQHLINIDDILKAAVEYKTRTNYSAIVADVHMQKVFLLRYLDRQTTHRTSRRMYGQLYITNTPAMPGDSGSCIYAKQPKQGCLGLLIGVHPDRSGSIVTPITEVLKAFRVKFSQT